MNVQAASPGGNAAQLDSALWPQLGTGRTRGEFLRAWLALQCQIMGGVASATVLTPDRATGIFSPAAVFPDASQPDAALAPMAELAMTERRGVLRPLGTPDGALGVAYPFVFDEELVGVLTLRLAPRDERQVRLLMRQLQWGAGWIELLGRREEAAQLGQRQARSAAALEVVVALIEARSYKAAALAVATTAARLLDCDRVSVGRIRRRRARVVAISHVTDLARNLHLSAALGEAMDEAIDQGASVWRAAGEGAPPDDAWVTRAQAALIRGHGAMAVLTVPLADDDLAVGAMTFEHRDPDGLSESRRDLARGIATVVAPILEAKRLADRSALAKLCAGLARQLGAFLGPAHLGRKLWLLLLAAVGVFLWLATATFDIPAQARLEGRVQRVISAPFDGYLAEQLVRPGDIVAEGTLMARFDDRDLRLQALAGEAELGELRIESNAALAAGERTEVALLEAQIAQSEARLDQLRAQLDRTEVRAPFAGVVVSGDHSRELGAAIPQGQELFVVAPLDSYRVMLRVDERDVAWMEPGQGGRVRFASQPDWAVPFEVSRVTPVAEASAGANRFLVEAELGEQDEAAPRLLPGMEGVGRIEVGERRLAWIWTRRAMDWARLTLWRWVP